MPDARAVSWLAVLLLLPAAPLGAQPQRPQTRQRADAGSAGRQSERDAEHESEFARDSPRAAMAEFLELTEVHDDAAAARYLDTSESDRTTPAELARKLRAVLDRHVHIELSLISPLPTGDPRDGLPSGVDEIARVPRDDNGSDPVRMMRKGDPARWVFTHATVQRIDAWYGAIELRWLLERVPDPLLKTGPHQVPRWQWLAMIAVGVAAALLGWALSRATIASLRPIARRTQAQWDDALLDGLRGPLSVGWMLVLWALVVPWLGLFRAAEDFIHQLVRGGLLAVFFWTLARSVEVAGQLLLHSAWARDRPSSQALVPLALRAGKVLILAVALIALFSVLGYPVASLLAGLGIGGLVVALAAQKTIENLFGAFSIGVDQPFRVGDFVKIEDITGTVEAIGLRSTRVRTQDRTLISFPNGKLAEMRLESYTARDRMRLVCELDLVRSTNAAQLRAILSGVERALRDHPKVWPEEINVVFTDIAEWSLRIEVTAWFQVIRLIDLSRIRQELLLRFMDIVEQQGTAFAYPAHAVPVRGELA
jgi:MscS family membrane protein